VTGGDDRQPQQTPQKRGRFEQERHAAENRIRFGRSKQRRGKDALETARAQKEIDEKRLE